MTECKHSLSPDCLHHRELLEAATRSTGLPGMYELSIGNADKVHMHVATCRSRRGSQGFLPEDEILRRVRQFEDAGLPVVVTQAPLFTQKAELFPKSVFAVGYDTAVRLVKPEYYGDETAMLLQFAKLVYRGCSFLVGGRVDDGGRFCTLDDVAIPEDLQRGGLFKGMDESLFRCDNAGGVLNWHYWLHSQQGPVVDRAAHERQGADSGDMIPSNMKTCNIIRHAAWPPPVPPARSAMG